MASEQAYLHELRELVKARLRAMPSADLHEIDGVRVFRAFHPGLVMVYNLDGLLLALQRARHAFHDMHGTPPDFLARFIHEAVGCEVMGGDEAVGLA
jgi:hypothetical protein